MNKSKIEWTDRTWNCVVGCTKVSQGCKLCYAKTIHDMRHKAHQEGKKVAPQYAHPFETVQLMPDRLQYPLSLRAPSRIFVNSVSDLFHENVPDEFIDRIFAVMALASRHTFQILTKRPEHMREYLSVAPTRWASGTMADTQIDKYLVAWNRFAHLLPLANVWLGVSVENQEAFHERVPVLLHTPAAIRFLSCEPLLGPIDLGESIKVECCDKSDIINWVIVGGESGSSKQNPRPMHPDWARSLRDQCVSANIPFLFKQWGEWVAEDQSPAAAVLPAESTAFYGDAGPAVFRVGKTKAGRELDGVTWDQYPQPRTT